MMQKLTILLTVLLFFSVVFAQEQYPDYMREYITPYHQQYENSQVYANQQAEIAKNLQNQAQQYADEIQRQKSQYEASCNNVQRENAQLNYANQQLAEKIKQAQAQMSANEAQIQEYAKLINEWNLVYDYPNLASKVAQCDQDIAAKELQRIESQKKWEELQWKQKSYANKIRELQEQAEKNERIHRAYRKKSRKSYENMMEKKNDLERGIKKLKSKIESWEKKYRHTGKIRQDLREKEETLEQIMRALGNHPMYLLKQAEEGIKQIQTQELPALEQQLQALSQSNQNLDQEIASLKEQKQNWLQAQQNIQQKYNINIYNQNQILRTAKAKQAELAARQQQAQQYNLQTQEQIKDWQQKWQQNKQAIDYNNNQMASWNSEAYENKQKALWQQYHIANNRALEAAKDAEQKRQIYQRHHSFYEAAWKRGKTEGWQQGLADGKTAAEQQGYNNASDLLQKWNDALGYLQGLQEGKEKGYQEGMHTGRKIRGRGVRKLAKKNALQMNKSRTHGEYERGRLEYRQKFTGNTDLIQGSPKYFDDTQKSAAYRSSYLAHQHQVPQDNSGWWSEQQILQEIQNTQNEVNTYQFQLAQLMQGSAPKLQDFQAPMCNVTRESSYSDNAYSQYNNVYRNAYAKNYQEAYSQSYQNTREAALKNLQQQYGAQNKQRYQEGWGKSYPFYVHKGTIDGIPGYFKRAYEQVYQQLCNVALPVLKKQEYDRGMQDEQKEIAENGLVAITNAWVEEMYFPSEEKDLAISVELKNFSNVDFRNFRPQFRVEVPQDIFTVIPVKNTNIPLAKQSMRVAGAVAYLKALKPFSGKILVHVEMIHKQQTLAAGDIEVELLDSTPTYPTIEVLTEDINPILYVKKSCKLRINNSQYLPGNFRLEIATTNKSGDMAIFDDYPSNLGKLESYREVDITYIVFSNDLVNKKVPIVVTVYHEEQVLEQKTIEVIPQSP